MWETFLIHAVLGFLKASIKNPGRAAHLEQDLLEVRDTINELFPESKVGG